MFKFENVFSHILPTSSENPGASIRLVSSQGAKILYDPDKLLLCSHSAKWSGVEYMTEWPHQEPMLRLSLN